MRNTTRGAYREFIELILEKQNVLMFPITGYYLYVVEMEALLTPQYTP